MIRKLHIAEYLKELELGLQRKDIYFTLIIIAVNVLYRIPFLTSSGLWFDEIFSVYHSQFDIMHIIGTCKWDVSAPGYYYVLHFWMRLFGETEFSVRFLSVLFMALTGGVIYLFSKKYLNVHIGLFTLLLFLASDKIFFYSHETRTYAMLCFFTSILLFLLFQHFTSPSKKNSFAIGIIMSMMFYSHYLSALLILPLSIFMLLKIKHYTNLLYVIAGFLLIIAHWLKRTFEVLFSNGTGWNTFVPQTKDLLLTLKTFFVGSYAAYLVLIIIIAGFFFLIKNKHSIFTALLFLASSIGTLLLFYLGSRVSPMWIDRYFLFILIPFYFLVALLLYAIDINIYIKYAIIVLIAVNGILETTFNIPPRMDYRNGTAFIKDSLETDSSKIILQTVDVMTTFSYYYNKEIFEHKDIREELIKHNVYSMNDTSEIESFNVSNCSRIIHIQTFVWGTDEITPYLERFYERKKRYTNFNDVIISVYEK